MTMLWCVSVHGMCTCFCFVFFGEGCGGGRVSRKFINLVKTDAVNFTIYDPEISQNIAASMLNIPHLRDHIAHWLVGCVIRWPRRL